MKNCPNCNAQLADEAMFCTNCGNAFQNMNQQPNNTYYNQQMPQQNPAYAQPVPPVVDPFDHTSEFDEKDVHENKLFALLVYLSSVIGIIIALLAKKNSDSPYLTFHIKQALKIFISEAIVALLTALLAWTCIAAIAGAVASIIIVVVNVICFIQTCQNKSIEVPIIRSIKFLN